MSWVDYKVFGIKDFFNFLLVHFFLELFVILTESKDTTFALFFYDSFVFDLLIFVIFGVNYVLILWTITK